jgi:hypothetical protein
MHDLTAPPPTFSGLTAQSAHALNCVTLLAVDEGTRRAFPTGRHLSNLKRRPCLNSVPNVSHATRPQFRVHDRTTSLIGAATAIFQMHGNSWVQRYTSVAVGQPLAPLPRQQSCMWLPPSVKLASFLPHGPL